MITRGVVKGSLGLHSPVGSSSAYSLRPRTHELTAYLSKPDHGSTVPSADHMSSNTLPPFLFCSPESRLLVCCDGMLSEAHCIPRPLRPSLLTSTRSFRASAPTSRTGNPDPVLAVGRGRSVARNGPIARYDWVG
jgi:hypothetical protein